MGIYDGQDDIWRYVYIYDLIYTYKYMVYEGLEGGLPEPPRSLPLRRIRVDLPGRLGVPLGAGSMRLGCRDGLMKADAERLMRSGNLGLCIPVKWMETRWGLKLCFQNMDG